MSHKMNVSLCSFEHTPLLRFIRYPVNVHHRHKKLHKWRVTGTLVLGQISIYSVLFVLFSYETLIIFSPNFKCTKYSTSMPVSINTDVSKTGFLLRLLVPWVSGGGRGSPSVSVGQEWPTLRTLPNERSSLWFLENQNQGWIPDMSLSS